jgi:hypothetical protein
MRRNTDKGRFPFCLGEDVIHILLECLETGMGGNEISK